jgi:hypothetical protein
MNKFIDALICFLGMIAVSMVFFAMIPALVANEYSMLIPCMGYFAIISLFVFGAYESLSE